MAPPAITNLNQCKGPSIRQDQNTMPKTRDDRSKERPFLAWDLSAIIPPGIDIMYTNGIPSV
jgi:hypothetical protein